LERFSSIKDPKRRRYAAQVSLMDDAIGESLKALRETSQDTRTLVFFFSDNGGPVGDAGNGSDNRPLRGGKGTLYEGGVRVPFLVSWPGRIPSGKSYDRTVSAIDVFATSLAAAGVAAPTDRKYDSVNLLPFLTGKESGAPRERLFWRSGRHRAILDGNLKLVRMGENPPELYDLAVDPTETGNLAGGRKADVDRLSGALQSWDGELIPPAFPGLSGRAGAKKPKS
jgi:arylsulfatase A-like enzyme